MLTKAEQQRIKSREERILSWLKKKKIATRAEAAKYLKCSSASAAQIMGHLARIGKIALTWSGDLDHRRNHIHNFVMPGDSRAVRPNTEPAPKPFLLAEYWPLPFQLPSGKPRTVVKE